MVIVQAWFEYENKDVGKGIELELLDRPHVGDFITLDICAYRVESVYHVPRHGDDGPVIEMWCVVDTKEDLASLMAHIEHYDGS